MDTTNILMGLGLSEKETKLYLTLLEIGPNPVSSVARKANITRTTAYAALETLKEKGLVSTVEKSGIQQFAPVHPRKLEEFAKEQQDKAQRNYTQIKEILPELKSLTGDLVMAPRVKYFEGTEGIKTIYNDTIETLKQLPKKDRIKYSYSSAPEISSDLRGYLNEYIKLRKKESITVHGIFPDSEESWAYVKDQKKYAAEARIMPKDISLDFESEIVIYGDKFAVMSLHKDRLHGVIIESPEIASTQRMLFHIIWRASKISQGL